MRAEAAIPSLLAAPIGCFELVGTERIARFATLKGKTSASWSWWQPHVFVSTMLAHVGLDPRKTSTGSSNRPADSMQLLADGKIDAFLAFLQNPRSCTPARSSRRGQQHARSPVSQYCCMILGIVISC